MRSRSKRSSRGYSLAELLVVVAIIGILSLIGVPAFINYQRANYGKSALRQLTHDFRGARQYAVTHSVWVRVELELGENSQHRYWYFSSADNGTTWTPLPVPAPYGAAPTTGPVLKNLSGPVWIDSTTLPDKDGNGLPDVVYEPNGSLWLGGGANGTIVLATHWTNIQFNRYTITLGPSGSLTSTAWHT